MNIYPEMKCKPIEQCEPGELIRLRLVNNYWAFIATDSENNKFFVVLPNPPDKNPSYCYISGYTRYVLSYGKDWNILIDQDSANVNLEVELSHAYEDMFILDGTRYLLVIPPPNKYTGISIYLDLSSWKIADPPKARFTMFSKWSLEVSIGGDRFKTLVSFPLEAEQ